MKNKIVLSLLLMCILAPSYGVNYADYDNQGQGASIELQNNTDSIDVSVDEAIQNSTKEVVTPHVEDVTIMKPNANEEVTKEVLKDTDSNLKFTLKKFLCAMAGVAFSSIIIFVILTIMNKINGIKGIQPPRKEEEEERREEIAIPAGEVDALKIFLDKTK